MEPFIQNVSWNNVANGNHFNPGVNSVLISITDPTTAPPTPKHNFKEIYYFQFLDVEDTDEYCEEFGINQTQAKDLVNLLIKALDNKTNIIVHCHAGICRSGAVCEVGVILGFRDTESHRSPNLRVKNMMMEELLKQQGLVSYAELEKQNNIKS